jgi:hypothetical protein
MSKAYKYENMILTMENMALEKVQEALLHPYPAVRAQAEAMSEAMNEIVVSLKRQKLSKNEALNTIAHYPAKTQPAADAIPVMRTRITSGRLDRQTLIFDMGKAEFLLQTGKGLAQATNDANEIKQWKWVEQALDRLKAEGFERVNFTSLCGLSQVGMKYAPATDQKPTDEADPVTLRDAYIDGFMRAWQLRDRFVDKGINDSGMEIEKEAKREASKYFESNQLLEVMA